MDHGLTRNVKMRYRLDEAEFTLGSNARFVTPTTTNNKRCHCLDGILAPHKSPVGNRRWPLLMGKLDETPCLGDGDRQIEARSMRWSCGSCVSGAPFLGLPRLCRAVPPPSFMRGLQPVPAPQTEWDCRAREFLSQHGWSPSCGRGIRDGKSDRASSPP